MPLLTIDDLHNASDVLDRLDDAKGMSALYTEYLAKMEDGGGHRAAGIHASEISKCYRQAVYTMIGQEKRFAKSDDMDEEEMKAWWRKILDHGHAIHAMIQGQFHGLANNSRSFITFEDEVKIRPGPDQIISNRWDLHSSCDGLFTMYAQNEVTQNYEPTLRLGLEIKSSKSSRFEKMKEPEAAHIEQIHVYMAALNIPIFWMVYFNKDNQNITPSQPPWLIRFDASLWTKLEKRFEMFNEHAAAGTLPDRMTGSHCGFCSYKWACEPPTRSSFRPLSPLRR
jgi:hypothetical protein